MEELYTCSYCEVEIDWEDFDVNHGNIWICESCGKCFCTKCFEDKVSAEEFNDMFNNCDTMMCPDCYEKYQDELKNLDERVCV